MHLPLPLLLLLVSVCLMPDTLLMKFPPIVGQQNVCMQCEKGHIFMTSKTPTYDVPNQILWDNRTTFKTHKAGTTKWKQGLVGSHQINRNIFIPCYQQHNFGTHHSQGTGPDAWGHRWACSCDQDCHLLPPIHTPAHQHHPVQRDK